MKAVSLFFPIFLAACGGPSGYPMTFDTDPESAVLVCDGKAYGYTPRTLYYDIDRDTDDTLKVNCYAQWNSGAVARYSNNLRVYKKGGTIQTLSRPNVPGRGSDVSFDLQVKQLQATREATEAAQSAARAARSAGNRASIQSMIERNNRMLQTYVYN
jgi:hypothetical protein